MNSKKEIEDYLGMKIESYYTMEVESIYGEEQVPYDRYVFGQRIPANYRKEKALPKETEDALKKLIKESVEKNDMETAATCHFILIDNTSGFKDVKSIDGLNEDQIAELMKYEQEQSDNNKREREEQQARLKAEQEAKEKAEEQARLKAEQEAKEKAEEQARLKVEQEAKKREEQQARLKAEQEEKERQSSIDKDIAEYKQYEELIIRKPELDKLLEELKYEDFSVAVNGHTSERLGELLNDLKKLPQNERKIILQQYNKYADLTINEQGDITIDGVAQNGSQPEVKDSEQESKKAEQVIAETIENDSNVIEETTGTSIDIDNASMMEAHLEYMRNHQTQPTSQVVEDYWNEIHSQQAKIYEQQQPEKIRPREKSIKDEVGEELKTTEKQVEQSNQSVDLWMNRFNGWYSAIDKVSQSVKDKFVKMKSDILKAISEKLKEKTNSRQVNTQEQDTNER